MDSERFDGLVRSFGQSRTRRQTLRGLAGAVAVGAFAVGGREASADVCKTNGKVCKNTGQCCSDLTCVVAGQQTNAPKKNTTGTCQPGEACIPLQAECTYEDTCCGLGGCGDELGKCCIAHDELGCTVDADCCVPGGTCDTDGRCQLSS